MYNISWQVVPFTYNANKERIFVAITNRSFRVKFMVMVSSCTSTFGKLKSPLHSSKKKSIDKTIFKTRGIDPRELAA